MVTSEENGHRVASRRHEHLCDNPVHPGAAVSREYFPGLAILQQRIGDLLPTDSFAEALLVQVRQNQRVASMSCAAWPDFIRVMSPDALLPFFLVFNIAPRRCECLR